MDRQELQRRIAEGEHFQYLFFWGHTQKEEEIDASCLSQWFPASFEIDGQIYSTAEHFMMAEKARLFQDKDALAEIRQAPSPAEAKQWGRKVRGFSPEIWKQHRSNIVEQGNIAKFGQNPSLKSFLLQTEGKVLVEASPRDRIWGIGLGQNNPKASDPYQWRGLNLLGFALMKVRGELRGESHEKSLEDHLTKSISS